MLYSFNVEMKRELLKGKSSIFVSNEMGVSKQHTCYVLNNKKNCSKTFAIAILSVCDLDYRTDLNKFFKVVK
jgi:hypothetical protein